MKCPHCDKEIPGVPCPECNATVPEGASYCMECGTLLDQEPGNLNEDDNSFSLEDRVLCPDGTCTGIIVDGKCTECGKALDAAKE